MMLRIILLVGARTFLALKSSIPTVVFPIQEYLFSTSATRQAERRSEASSEARQVKRSATAFLKIPREVRRHLKGTNSVKQKQLLCLGDVYCPSLTVWILLLTKCKHTEDTGMKTIPLTNSVDIVLISDDDYDRVSKHKWFVRKNGYVQSSIGLLHRFVVDAPSSLEVDHLNRFRLDNRRENLYICTHAQNCKNKGKWGKSGEKYVYYKKKSRLWCVQIPVNGKVKTVGYGKTRDAAVEIRDAFLSK